MTFSRVVDYDDMPVFVAEDLVSFSAAVGRNEVTQGVSMGFVLGDMTEESIENIADLAARLAPTLVHCFGPSSEVTHDAIDAALLKRGHEGIPTYWTMECVPTEIIFDFFCTDLPAEPDFERWTGRLLILDGSLPRRVREDVLNGLLDIDASVELAVRNGPE